MPTAFLNRGTMFQVLVLLRRSGTGYAFDSYSMHASIAVHTGYCAGGEPSDGAVTGVNRIHDATSPTPWDMRLDGYNDIDFRRSPSAWGDPGLGDMYGDNVNFCDECLLDHPFAIRGDGLVEDILDMIAKYVTERRSCSAHSCLC